MIDNVHLALPTRSDERGYLTFMEGERQVPFAIRRIYTIYGVAPGYNRGHHAHRTCRQVLLPVAGAVTVVMDDGKRKRSVRADWPGTGILIEPMVWHTLEDFAPGTVCVVLASHAYDEADYIRDFEEYKRLVAARP
jgi:dTDP-4-dehydrorhamnose 3,5-epimerase-like enzyme